jgi:FlaA1/EpsC-like NDP-sugar epimerase
MLIPEAVSLVLQAAQSSKTGDIYVLDMGEPVKILDLARDLIAITGMKEGVDIHIEFKGLRKGEKMFEELYLGSEELERVSSDYYRVASSNIMESSFIQRLHYLLSSLHECSPATAKALLFELIKVYDHTQQTKTPETEYTRPLRDDHEFKPVPAFDPLEVGV